MMIFPLDAVCQHQTRLFLQNCKSYMLLYSIIHAESNVYVSSFVAHSVSLALFNLKSAKRGNFYFSVRCDEKFYFPVICFPPSILLYHAKYKSFNDREHKLIKFDFICLLVKYNKIDDGSRIQQKKKKLYFIYRNYCN